MNQNDKPKPHFSRHLFLFPFRWEIKLSPIKKRRRFFTKGILDIFDSLLRRDSNSTWKRSQFEFATNNEPAVNYNEYTYFYDFMRSALYDTEAGENEPVNYYEYEIGTSAKFKIKVFDNKEPFDLSLTGISLHVFETGVAVLTFSLLNTKYDSADDILLINQLGRRLYPEFLGNGTSPLDAPLNANYIAEYISLELDAPISTPRVIQDSFHLFRNPDKLWHNHQPFSVPMPDYVTELFPDDIFSFTPRITSDILSKRETIAIFQPIMDDRMFVLCWYGSNEWSDLLKHYNFNEEQFQYENDKFWYAFTFCDSNMNRPTCSHPRMLKEHIRESTYERWAGYGTLFGITRDTFMVLTEGKQRLSIPIDQHVYRIYYQFVILCLVQRASLLQFKMQVGTRSKQVLTSRRGQLNEELVDEIGQLYLRYLDFINRLFYREITSQIQGDELYNKLQKQMRLRDEVEVLDREISELHSHVETLQTRDISRAVNILAPLTIVSLFFGFIGIDKLAYPLDNWEVSSQYLFYTFLLVLFTIVAIIFARPILHFSQRIGFKYNSYPKEKV